jgi:hypothetical protein
MPLTPSKGALQPPHYQNISTANASRLSLKNKFYFSKRIYYYCLTKTVKYVKCNFMAVSRNKKGDGFVGRIGDEVIYWLNGQLVKRKIGKSYKKPTLSQLAVRQCTGVINKFLDPILDFIDIGFELEAKRASLNQHNVATSYNRNNAIKGEYPNQVIDYTNALVTMGSMPIAADAVVLPSDEGLAFTWDTELVKGMRKNDQVMVMAYFPEQQEARFIVNGAYRETGKQILKLPVYKTPRTVETYLSFISANHKSISNSTYTGKISW